MIVWGGIDNSFNILNSGGKYDPGTDTWVTTSIVNAPAARELHTAVWTGSEMIVWGGTGPTISIPVAGITPTQTVGHPLAPLMHRLGDTAPQQCDRKRDHCLGWN